MGLRRWILVGCAVMWLAGVALAGSLALASAGIFGIAGGGLAVCAIVMTALASRAGRTNRASIIGRVAFALWLAASLSLGIARLAWAQPASDPHNIAVLVGGQRVTVQGNVSGEPDVRAKGEFITIQVSTIQVGTDGTIQRADGTAEVFAYGTPGVYAPDYGDTVSFTATIQKGHALPGIDADFGVARVSIVQRGGGNPVLATIYRLREGLAGAISASMPAPEAALLIGILLGLKTPSLRSRLALYTRTGTIHLVVTSGLKVTLIGSLIAAITRKIPRLAGLIVTLGGIAGYVVLSGAGPAAIRAGIMGALLVLARWLRRDYDIFNALAVACVLMTAITPFVVWDAGFQLSAAGTLGIAIIAPPLRSAIAARCGRVWGGAAIADVLATTIAAQVATFPIVAITFGLISLIAPLTNLLLVPLLPVFLVLGTLVGVAGLAASGAGAVVGIIIWPLLWLADKVIEIGAAVPGSALTGIAVPGWLTPVWVSLIGALPLLWRGRGAAQSPMGDISPHRLPLAMRAGMGATALVALFTVALGMNLITPPAPLTITFLDSGTGGPATLVRLSTGRTILIDGGGDGPTLLASLAQALPFWQRDIDLVVVTDVRPGHIAGLAALAGAYRVHAAVDPGALHPESVYTSWYHTLQGQGIPLTRLARGDKITLGAQIWLDVLNPVRPLSDGTAQQDANALVLRLVSPGLRVLFAGDASDTALVASIGASGDSRADIVQICQLPNEGILAGTPLADVLVQTRPRLVLVAPSARPAPKAGTLAAAPASDDPQAIAGMTVVRTSQAGSVIVTSDNQGWAWK
jgi:competence protein ComEC